MSSVESKYLKNLKKVEAREIDNMLMSFLSYFMTLQLIRVDKFITENQKNWDQIANSCDMFCDGNYYEKLFKNIVKKQIPICDLGEIPYQNARIIYNNTTFPFISSDNPVIKREVNNADLSMVIPNSLITNDVKNSKESPFFFFPLTPWIAYISCDLIQADKVIEFDNNNLKNIFYLNYWSILNADIHVYSSVKEPLKGEAQLSQYLMMTFDSKESVVKICTENTHFVLKGKLVSNTENSLSIICDSKNELSQFVLGEKISLVEVFNNNSSICGMRYCSIQALDLNEKKIIFESDFKL
ncbi:DUF4238 domain-containing protein [Acinetobacter wuhouensis]|uniref:DUF4238 domain-containing protein n=1 Tax=Acinetobacter wuhouensis TaxID=1879050 RepID=A0A4Q7AJM8_9GAMM|nr:DUF4238 domain-containing protein [Acinetobacter wuhouensis]RZG43531.1 DUF4238 domain-containing protein [Acinetobacter wuhouensis]RZG70354.1 DUF4238 domain-containing protein [Acinetobacter wuhouensis]